MAAARSAVKVGKFVDPDDGGDEKGQGQAHRGPHRGELIGLDVIGPQAEERPEGQKDEDFPQTQAHQLDRRGGIAEAGQQAQEAEDRHPVAAGVNQGQAADNPHGQEEIGQGLDRVGVQFPVLDHPAAAAEGGDVDVQGVTAEGVVIVVDQVGPQVQAGHAQQVEAEEARVKGVVEPVGQGGGRGHRQQGAGKKGQPQGLEVD